MRGFLAQSFWCGFLVRIFRCGVLVRIFRVVFLCVFFAFLQGDRRESDKINPAGRSIKKSSPKFPLQKSSPKSSPNSSPICQSVLTWSHGSVGAHLDALVEVGSKSHRPSANRWQWLPHGYQVGVEDLQAPQNSGLHKTFNMGSVVSITSHNACISTPLWGSVSFRLASFDLAKPEKKKKNITKNILTTAHRALFKG